MAAYLVFLHHFTPSPEVVGPTLRGILAEGHIGVTMFFVLSGFLITYRYDGKLSLTRQDLKRYFWNRFARIYPLYLALLIPTLILIPERRFGRWIVELTLFKGFFDDYKFNGIPQAWSLTVEECFYAAAPLLLLALRTRYRVVVLPGIYLLGTVLLGIGSELDYRGLFGNLGFLCSFTFFGRCLEFFLGAWLAMNIRRLEVFRSVPHKTYLGLAGMAASMVILSAIQGGSYIRIVSPASVLMNNMILPFWIALFYLGLIQDDSLLKRALSTPISQLLGKASYAFYLIHLGFIATYLTSQNISGVWFFLALNAIAIVLFKMVEEPINRWLRKRGPGRSEADLDDRQLMNYAADAFVRKAA
jgi:peptidoglycan/LPS O-acetylase OafA/YrhL